MSQSVSFSQAENMGRDFRYVDMNSLMAELDQFKKKTARLSLLNELHARLAGAVDLPSMIEAFSVWLMPLMQHDLVAYHNPDRKRSYMYSSCHGPDRQRIFQLAEKLFDSQPQNVDHGWYDEDFYVQNWHLGSMDSSGLVLVLRQSKVIDAEEVALINQALEVLREPLQRALDYEDLFVIARRDTLTGLANRRVFEERIGPLMDNSKRHHHPLTISCMDLDHFKQVNDNLGHAEGDRVLIKVADTFKGMVRSSDLLVRMGGDEFFLVLPETNLKSAKVLAERLCKAIDDLAIYSAPGQKLGVSIGLSQWQPDMTIEDWLQDTDELLYQAKDNGRSQVCL
ncbi:MAG: GGDEF domain-containing protein [Proteobacteria bacterium]|nr:GGDEF domain-containing protein [Pseudomonadota bacterium]MBU4295080.1 GGDEF domain-containing protein [Pseudomonadota bacterium]MCG2749979.1 GGDEF domain-containing protein [Desulfobulbaceae bacterium]